MKRFPAALMRIIEASKSLGIRAGKKPHSFTALWFVMVEGRVFVRSWGVKADGWHSALMEQQKGVMQLGERQVRVRAVRTRSERLKDAVDAAYAAKYNTPSSRKWVKDLRSAKCRDTTTELVPQ